MWHNLYDEFKKLYSRQPQLQVLSSQKLEFMMIPKVCITFGNPVLKPWNIFFWCKIFSNVLYKKSERFIYSYFWTLFEHLNSYWSSSDLKSIFFAIGSKFIYLSNYLSIYQPTWNFSLAHLNVFWHISWSLLMCWIILCRFLPCFF